MASHGKHQAYDLDVRRRFSPSRFHSLALARAFELVLPLVRRPLTEPQKGRSSAKTHAQIQCRSGLLGGTSS
jgi:hypothetical protein